MILYVEIKTTADIACFDNNNIRGNILPMLLQCDGKAFSHLGEQRFDPREKPGPSTSCKILHNIKLYRHRLLHSRSCELLLRIG